MSLTLFKTLGNETLKDQILQQLGRLSSGAMELAQVRYTGAAVHLDNILIGSTRVWTVLVATSNAGVTIDGSLVSYTPATTGGLDAANANFIPTTTSNYTAEPNYPTGSGTQSGGLSAGTNPAATANPYSPNTGSNAYGVLNPAPVVLVTTGAAHGLSVNQVCAVGTEFFLVKSVPSTTTVWLQRGYAGSTIATHASSSQLITAASYTGVNLGTVPGAPADVILPVTALAIATAGPQLATGLSNLLGLTYGITGRYTPNILQMFRQAQGNTLSITKTGYAYGGLTAASAVTASYTAVGITNAGVIDTAFSAGVQIGDGYLSFVSRAPTAQEVTDGIVNFFLPFTTKTVEVGGTVTSTGLAATIGSTIAVTAVTQGNGSPATVVSFTNNSTNNFAATNTLWVRASA